MKIPKMIIMLWCWNFQKNWGAGVWIYGHMGQKGGKIKNLLNQLYIPVTHARSWIAKKDITRSATTDLCIFTSPGAYARGREEKVSG